MEGRRHASKNLMLLEYRSRDQGDTATQALAHPVCEPASLRSCLDDNNRVLGQWGRTFDVEVFRGDAGDHTPTL